MTHYLFHSVPYVGVFRRYVDRRRVRETERMTDAYVVRGFISPGSDLGWTSTD